MFSTLTLPNATVLQNDIHLEQFKKWAKAGRSNGAHFWMQINHPGRQVYSAMGEQAVSVDFVRDIATIASMPIMVTGGIRKKQIAEQALAINDAGFSVSMLGIARAMAFKPEMPNAWLEGRSTDIELPVINWKNKMLSALALMAVTKAQLHRMAHGKFPKSSISPVPAVLSDRIKTMIRTRRYRRWRSAA